MSMYTLEEEYVSIWFVLFVSIREHVPFYLYISLHLEEMVLLSSREDGCSVCYIEGNKYT